MLTRYAILFGILIQSFLPSNSTDAKEMADYYPLEVGLTWIYGDSLHKARAVGSLEAPDGETYTWLDWGGIRRALRNQSDGKVFEFLDGASRLLFDFGAIRGSSWTISAPEDGFDILDGTTVTLVSASEEVKVPFGTFEDCIHLGMRPPPNLSDAGFTDMWFAPDVGLIKWSEIWIGGVRSFELSHFSGAGPRPPVTQTDPIVVRPESYPNIGAVERNGIRYEVATDRTSYNRGDVIGFRYSVTAVDRDSVTFTFGSTQQIEFLLVDAEDFKVWVWSDGKAFGEALTRISLTRTEAHTFEQVLQLSAESVRMLSIDQAQIPPGTYRLIGFLPTTTIGTVEPEETQVDVPISILGDLRLARLKGEVLEENPEGLSNFLTEVRVSIIQETGTDPTPLPTEVLTGGAGLFAFQNLQPGTYRITVNKNGFRSVSTTAILEPGENRLSFSLKGVVEADYPNDQIDVGDRLWVEIGTDRQEYTQQDSVSVRYRLVNTSSDTLNLMFRSGQRYDLVLENREGEVWKWSDDKAFTLALQTQDLAPGDTVEVHETFRLSEVGADAEGSYSLDGYMEVSADDPGAVTLEETRGRVKFLVFASETAGPSPDPKPGDILGDFNRDDSVDFDDFFMFVNAFGTKTGMPSFRLRFDLNTDGSITLDDFFVFAAHFGTRN